jgi:hypothetical protein
MEKGFRVKLITRIAKDARGQQFRGVVEIARLCVLLAAFELLLQAAANGRRKRIVVAASIGHDWIESVKFGREKTPGR